MQYGLVDEEWEELQRSTRRIKTMRIREATVTDASAIARVHLQSWRTTYHGIMTDEYLAELDVGEWERGRGHEMAHPGVREFTYVAEQGSEVVGFADGGPERSGDTEHEGQLYNIHILRAHQGNGTGRRLTAVIAGRLIDEGMGSMLVWVLTENLPARRFYERLGGVYIRQRQIDVDGAKLVEVAYGWRDIARLAKI